MNKILGILLCLISLNCYASEKEITPTLLEAAIADTVTTQIGLNSGAIELNPIGFYGATIVKGILLFVINDKLEEDDKYFIEKAGSSLWMGGAVNNVFVILHSAPFIAAASGIITAIVIWNNN